jgi:hypothetical protein
MMRIAEEAASRRMDEMLRAWDKEIQQEFEALREDEKKHEIERDQQTQVELHRAQQEAADLALDAAVANALQNAITDSKGGEKSLTIPTGVHVASTTIHGPGVDLAALREELDDDRDTLIDSAKSQQARDSAMWALGHGLMPHPGDLSTLLKSAHVDQDYAGRFDNLKLELNKIDRDSQNRNPQIQGYNAHQRVGVLNELNEALASFGAQRLVALIVRPSRLQTIAPAGALPSLDSARNVLPPGVEPVLAEFASKVTAAGGSESTANRTLSPRQRAAQRS